MKQRKAKRLIALVMTMCMMITSLPAAGYASVQASEPVQVNNVKSLNAAAAYVFAEGEEEEIKDFSEVTEEDIIPEESSEDITTYDLGGNYKAKVFYSYDVRYAEKMVNG